MERLDNYVGRTADNYIEGFIRSQVTGRGLNERTEKAYRLDLEHLCRWLEREKTLATRRDDEEEHLERMDMQDNFPVNMESWEGKIQQYLIYLSQEKKLRGSTISRKYRVFTYFFAYLTGQGMPSAMSGNIILKPVNADMREATGPLSKAEVDAFFLAMRREREEVESNFRRRVCLRDQVMMELLFYHGIEISELLKLELGDYDRVRETLTVRKKHGKVCVTEIFSKELKELIEKWIEEHGYFERVDEFQNRLFLSKLGRPLSMKMVILVFEKYRQLAGIEKEFTPKDLKNSLGRYGEEMVREKCGGKVNGFTINSAF